MAHAFLYAHPSSHAQTRGVLGLRLVLPVHLSQLQKPRHDGDVRDVRLVDARLQQQHRGVGDLGQAGCHHRAARPAAHCTQCCRGEIICIYNYFSNIFSIQYHSFQYYYLAIDRF